MGVIPTDWGPRLRRLVIDRSFWTVVAMLAMIGLLHYLTAQIRSLSPEVNAFLSRHAVERIIFTLPVAGAAFAFGRVGGLITLVIAILIMLPRAIWLSAYPVDAIVETVATSVLGYLILWMIEIQEKERALRQKIVARMRAFNAMCSIVAQSLELEQVLNDTLDKALEITGLDSGLIFFLDHENQELVLTAYRGVSEEFAQGVDRLKLGEGFSGRVVQSGETMVIDDSSQDPRLTREVVKKEGLRSQIIVPLESKGKVQGAMALASRQVCKFLPEDLQLITTFGKQIGVGVENAHLHQDLEQRLHTQRRLTEVAEQITSELELDRILPKVLQIAKELVDADCGDIALFDPKRNRITYPYLNNLPEELTEITVLERDGVSGEVVATGRPIVVEDYRTYPKAIPAFVETGLTSIMAVPITSSNRSFGALSVGTLNRPKRPSERDMDALIAIGRQAGIAIENAHLYQNMRFYTRQVIQAQENERKRVAREAHDETAQILVALSRRLDALVASPEGPGEAVAQNLAQLRQLTTDALQSVRRFSRGLRPPVLDDLGFVAAVRGLTRDLEEMGIGARVEVSGSKQRLLPEEELVLFRIAQEALNNVRRHSGASHVAIHVEFHPTSVRMTIKDDGRGFSAPNRFVDLVASGKLGLVGMHERARILGGVLQIQAGEGQGTWVIADVPVHSRRLSESA